MPKLKSSYKIFIFLTAVAAAIWLGSYVSRFSAFYNIFAGPELDIRGDLNPESIRGIFFGLLSPLSTSIFSYFSFLVFFYLSVIFSGLNIKRHGWLFISLLMVTLTAPFEIFLIWKYDIEMLYQILSSQFDSLELVSFYIDRIKMFSFMPFVMVLTIITLFGLFIFRPFEMKNDQNEA
ncbi:MAG: hypothetical protein HUU54_05075 [Ignavibacteriaceae bacterium]|nr:hypothetical protein [Ignavibacteriaceae bacterium]